MGYQPGGGSEAHHQYLHCQENPPDTLEYLNRGQERLWDEIAALINDDQLLKNCVGMNAIFFRSPTIRAWRNIDPHLRANLTQFSLDSTRSIVEAMRPRLIIMIGFATMYLFRPRPTCADLYTVDNRVLVKSSELFDIPALAVLHLTGAWIRQPHRVALRKFIRAQITTPDSSAESGR